LHDRAAATRLRQEVIRLYEKRVGESYRKTGLHELTHIGRPTLDNWLETGVMPPVDGMEKLAGPLDTDAKHLYAVWLGIGQDSALERIASEIGLLRRTLSPEAQADEGWLREQDGSSSIQPTDDDPDTPGGSSRPRVYRPSPRQGVSGSRRRIGQQP
jgi:hypothetical protein